MNPERVDGRLSELLREYRPAPALPPRFQEGVWRRIESTQAGKSARAPLWLDAVVSYLLRPKFAFAGLAVLLLVGTISGIRQGIQLARQESQAHYLAVVAPNLLH